MIKNILVAGGDMRQIYCAEKLSAKYSVDVIGFDEKQPDNKFYDCIVFPVVPLDSDGNISAPYSRKRINPEDTANMLKSHGIVFAGKPDSRFREIFSNFPVYDYMEREDTSLKNAVPTAEGAIAIALENLPVTLNGLKVLIVGFGRIGMALAEILKGFGADITTAVHNEKGTAKARICGVKSVYTDKMNTDFGLVFNTVPELIFDSELLKKFEDSTLFIDLASKPGGIDFSSAYELNKKVIWALGLPGKTAPVTAGQIIAETIDNIITERS